MSQIPEFTLGDYERMNTGAMLMNVSRLRQSLPEFRQFIISEKWLAHGGKNDSGRSGGSKKRAAIAGGPLVCLVLN